MITQPIKGYFSKFMKPPAGIQLHLKEVFFDLCKYPLLCLKLFRIILGTWNLVRKTHICLHTHIWKKSVFFGNNSTYIQSNIVRAVLENFSSVFSFCKTKGSC